MGHIHLTIQKNKNTKNYILSNADYLEEAWLAEVNENNTTRIVKQFRCKKFENCFLELKHYVKQLGNVTILSGSDIKDQELKLLERLLIKEDGILPITTRLSKFHDPFWHWIK